MFGWNLHHADDSSNARMTDILLPAAKIMFHQERSSDIEINNFYENANNIWINLQQSK